MLTKDTTNNAISAPFDTAEDAARCGVLAVNFGGGEGITDCPNGACVVVVTGTVVVASGGSVAVEGIVIIGARVVGVVVVVLLTLGYKIVSFTVALPTSTTIGGSKMT